MSQQHQIHHAQAENTQYLLVKAFVYHRAPDVSMNDYVMKKPAKLTASPTMNLYWFALANVHEAAVYMVHSHLQLRCPFGAFPKLAVTAHL
eukprot:scaffold138397_cov17-Prasinocladus_malaysianus.AAC.1